MEAMLKLYELHQEDLNKIETLLTGDRVNLEIKAIAGKNNPGWIFVDDCNNPKTLKQPFSPGQQDFSEDTYRTLTGLMLYYLCFLFFRAYVFSNRNCNS